MNGKPSQAWENYLKTDSNSGTFTILSMIAADCYRTGQFYYAAKAYDVLERLDPSPEYWEGKRGACIGWFQRIIAEKGDSLSLKKDQQLVELLLHEIQSHVTR